MRVLNFGKLTNWPTGAVYVGRDPRKGDPRWGNPYTHKEGTLAKHKVSDRTEAIARYRADIEELLQKDRAWRDAAASTLFGHDLICHCAPEACHGEILREVSARIMLGNALNEYVRAAPEESRDQARLEAFVIRAAAMSAAEASAEIGLDDDIAGPQVARRLTLLSGQHRQIIVQFDLEEDRIRDLRPIWRRRFVEALKAGDPARKDPESGKAVLRRAIEMAPVLTSLGSTGDGAQFPVPILAFDRRSGLRGGPILGLIGSYGQKEDGVLMTRDVFDALRGQLDEAISEWGVDTLVTGGGPFCEHVAVRAFLEGRVKRLILHVPSPFKNGRFNGDGDGAVLNFYHQAFSAALGIDSLDEIRQAIEAGAQLVVHQGSVPCGEAIGKEITHLLTITPGESSEPLDWNPGSQGFRNPAMAGIKKDIARQAWKSAVDAKIKRSIPLRWLRDMVFSPQLTIHGVS